MTCGSWPQRLALILVWLLSAWALGQTPATLELGFAGEIVAGAWNPLRLTVRDQPGALLTIVMDQGSLRSGEVLAEYRLRVPKGGGLQQLEDELFVPPWRSLSWRLLGAERVVASGSLDRRQLDSRPLTLLVSSRPAEWLPRLGADARTLELPPALLPERLAAYDGVARLIVDGSTAAPTPAALAAAASAGASVVLVEPLPESYAELLKLAPYPAQRLGAGQIVRGSREGLDLAALAAGALPQELNAELLESGLLELPAVPRTLPVLALAAGYLLIALLFIRLLGLPGLLSALVLAGVVSLYGWRALRPTAALLTERRTLVLASGALAREDEVRSLYSYPERRLALPLAARPTRAALPYRQDGDELTLRMSRAQELGLELKPRLVRAPLAWEGAQLRNRSGEAISDLVVTGLGPQGSLAPDQALTPRPGEEGPLTSPYRDLAPLLPAGSALARQGEAVVVALPSGLSVTGGLP